MTTISLRWAIFTCPIRPTRPSSSARRLRRLGIGSHGAPGVPDGGRCRSGRQSTPVRRPDVRSGSEPARRCGDRWRPCTRRGAPGDGSVASGCDRRGGWPQPWRRRVRLAVWPRRRRAAATESAVGTAPRLRGRRGHRFWRRRADQSDPGGAAQLGDGGHGHRSGVDRRRPGLLVGVGRRRRVQPGQCRFLRIARLPPAPGPDRGHGGHRRRQGLLAGRHGRRGLRLR